MPQFFFELIEHTQGVVEEMAEKARGEVSGVFLLLVGLGKQWKGWAVHRARALLGNGERGKEVGKMEGSGEQRARESGSCELAGSLSSCGEIRVSVERRERRER